MKYDVIVIGSGPGGYVAAVRTAQLGKKTALIERENLGGICLNWGCIPTKSLLKSATVYHYLSNAKEYGIDPGETLPKPNMSAIVARSRDIAENMSKGIRFLMKKHQVDVIMGTAKVLPNHRVEVTNDTESIYEADHIIIATGAHSRNLPNLPQDGKKIIGYREAMTLNRVPETMVVVGSGAIGSEFAHFYSTLGTQVTLVEFMPTVVPNEDADVAAALSRAFRKNKMKVMVDTSVEKVDTTGEKCKVTLKGKKGEQIIETDIVLSAVGVATNISGIGLEETGIVTERGKVIVDDYYQTNISGYYAIGDIVHGPALAHVASREAVICAEHICGQEVKPLNYKNIPGCTYTSPEIASVGLSEQKAKDAGYETIIGKFMFMASGKAASSGNKDGFVKVVLDAKTHALIGCHMIGDNVTEMIAEAVVAMEHNLTAEQILEAIHPHPTMSEGVMEALEAALGKAIHG